MYVLQNNPWFKHLDCRNSERLLLTTEGPSYVLRGKISSLQCNVDLPCAAKHLTYLNWYYQPFSNDTTETDLGELIQSIETTMGDPQVLIINTAVDDNEGFYTCVVGNNERKESQ